MYAHNRAGERGGAILVTGGSPILQIDRSTFYGNVAPEGSHIYGDPPGGWGVQDGSILAFGIGGAAVEGNGVLHSACSDVYGNDGGDWVGPLSGQLGSDGNIAVNPLFCGPATNDFTVASTSPCVVDLPPGCEPGPIGRYGVGCDDVVAIESTPGPGAGDAFSTARMEFTVSPSPTRGFADVRYRTLDDGVARMAVYGAGGRQVALLAESSTPGTYEVRWDARDAIGGSLPNGIYFVRLAQAGHVVSKRVVLLEE